VVLLMRVTQKVHHLLIGAFVAVLTLLVSVVAHATSLQVSLVAPAGDQPRYVCVTYRSKTGCDPGAIPVENFKAQLKPHADTGALVVNPVSVFTLKTHGKDFIEGEGGKDEKCNNVPKGQVKSNAPEVEALNAMVPPAPLESECGTSGDASTCSPRVHLEHDAYIRCASDPDVSSSNAVVLLGLQGAGLSSITAIKLKGSIVSIDYTSVPNVTTDLQVSLEGGHYATQGGSIASGQVMISLTKWCQPIDVLLPRVADSSNAGLDLGYCGATRGGSTVGHRCQRRFRAGMRVFLPIGRNGEIKSITARILPTSPTTPSDTSAVCNSSDDPISSGSVSTFAARWTEEFPRAVDLRATYLRFEWTPDTSYPFVEHEVQCPLAHLVDAGLDCRSSPMMSGARLLRCDYRCTAITPIVLPTTVSFTVPKIGDQWREPLVRVSDELSGYTDSGHRHLIVDMSHWAPRVSRIVGDRIESVELTPPSGKAARLGPEGRHFVVLDGVNSGETILFKLYGDREYAEAPVQVEAGQIRLPDVGKTSKQWSFGMMLGGGLEVPFANRFVGPVNDHVNVQPAGAIDASLRFKPAYKARPAQMSFETQFVGALSEMAYLALRAPGDVGPREAQTAMFARFALGAMPLVSIFQTVDIGFTPLGLGLGTPTRHEDLATVGRPSIYYAPYGLARLRFNRTFALELAARFNLFESTFLYQSDFRGSPHRTEFLTHSVFLQIGIRAWMLL
jgi:hypothetical protein